MRPKMKSLFCIASFIACCLCLVSLTADAAPNEITPPAGAVAVQGFTHVEAMHLEENFMPPENANQSQTPQTLSRSEMEKVIRSGGSVLYQGRTLTKIEELPNAVDLAHGEDQRRTARQDLERQKTAIDNQLKQLDAAEPKKAPAKTEAAKSGAAAPGATPAK